MREPGERRHLGRAWRRGRSYERLRRTCKPFKLAFVAVARKLLTILNAIAREKTAWQAEIP